MARRLSLALFVAAALALLADPLRAIYRLELAALPDAGLVLFYPLAFLPLFVERRVFRGFRPLEWLEIGVAGLAVLFALAAGIRTLVALSGIWCLLALVAQYGWQVGRFGRALFLLVPPLTLKSELVFGFSLRLFLSRQAGALLALVEPTTRIQGNQILYRDALYSVDPACEGLKMFTALLLVLFVVLHLRSRRGATGPSEVATGARKWKLALVVVFALAFWLGANLARILILIFADIPPESAAHGAWGLVLFACCVLFPVWVLDQLLFARTPAPAGAPSFETVPLRADGDLSGVASGPGPGRVGSWAGGFGLPLLLLVAAFTLGPAPGTRTFRWPASISGYEYRAERSFQGLPFDPAAIAVFERRRDERIEGLLLIKRNLNPLRVGHPPRRCWEGAGFTVRAERERELKGVGRVRLARIEKDSQSFEMVWWYEPATGGPTAPSEIDWRLARLFAGVPAVQFNLVAATEEEVLADLMRARKILLGHKQLWL